MFRPGNLQTFEDTTRKLVLPIALSEYSEQLKNLEIGNGHTLANRIAQPKARLLNGGIEFLGLKCLCHVVEGRRTAAVACRTWSRVGFSEPSNHLVFVGRDVGKDLSFS